MNASIKMSSFKLSFLLLLIACCAQAFAERPLRRFRATAGSATANRHSAATDLTSEPHPTFRPPLVRVTKQDFAHAKGWRIRWQGGSWDAATVQKVPSTFSTVTGAVNSVHYLNNTSWGNTNNADMMLFFGDLKSTKQVSDLTKASALKQTRFKLTSMTVADLEDAAKNNPAKFGVIYSLAFDSASEVKNDYKKGQIYVFKTDRSPAKYGAIRIVSMNPRIIEVVVQK